MNTQQELDRRQRIHDAAHRRARELRAEALDEAWLALSGLARAAVKRLARPAGKRRLPESHRNRATA